MLQNLDKKVVNLLFYLDKINVIFFSWRKSVLVGPVGHLFKLEPPKIKYFLGPQCKLKIFHPKFFKS